MPVTTEMGTRVLLFVRGGGVQVTNDSDGDVFLNIDEPVTRARISLVLTPYEALSLAESLIVGAKPGTGREIIEMVDLGKVPPEKILPNGCCAECGFALEDGRCFNCGGEK